VSCEKDNTIKKQINNSKNIKLSPKKILKFINFIIIPVITVFIIYKANILTNTANLLQLNNAIQIKTDHVYDIELKENEIRIAIRNDDIDEIQAKRLVDEKRNAITALLNTYEFACQQYLDIKIDRKAFKSFYKVMIKYIREEYSDFFTCIDGRETFPAINKVYKKWHIDK